MQKLEMIIKEIDEKMDIFRSEKHSLAYIAGGYDVEGMIKGIIKRHMNGEWVPIKEKLPANGERVLCYFEFEPYSPNIICENRYIGSGIWESESDKVVAWRPLPEPYKSERSEA